MGRPYLLTGTVVTPVGVKGLYSCRVIGRIFRVIIPVLVGYMRLVVVVAHRGIVPHRHAVLDVFVLRPVLFPGIAVRPGRNSVVGHVFEVVRAPIGAAVIVLVLDVANEVAVAAVLDDVVFVVERVVALQGLHGGIAVGIVVIRGGFDAIIRVIGVVFDQMVGHALARCRVAGFRGTAVATSVRYRAVPGVIFCSRVIVTCCSQRVQLEPLMVHRAATTLLRYVWMMASSFVNGFARSKGVRM